MPHFTLSSLTAHRFVIAAVVVASKALCDGFCTNAHYARVGGIRVGELNVLERELLSAIDWRLTVCTFFTYYNWLEATVLMISYSARVRAKSLMLTMSTSSERIQQGSTF